MEIKKGKLNYDQSGRAYPDKPHVKENWDCIWEYEGKHYKLVGDSDRKEWEEVEVGDWYNKFLSCCRSKEECHCNKKRIIIPKEESKQETLEEAAEVYAEIYRCPTTNTDEYCKHDIISAINFGAKWQQERSYSEEEVKSVIEKTLEQCNKMMQESYGLLEIDVDYIFEQFKKEDKQ